MGSVDNSSYGTPSLQIKPLYIRAAFELLIDGADRLRNCQGLTLLIEMSRGEMV